MPPDYHGVASIAGCCHEKDARAILPGSLERMKYEIQTMLPAVPPRQEGFASRSWCHFLLPPAQRGVESNEFVPAQGFWEASFGMRGEEARR